MITRKKVLIIDNDVDLYEAFQNNFSDCIDVLVVNSSEAGIMKATQWGPDLIILEIMIPGHQNGFDVLRRLKGNRETKNIPVIVYTKLKGEKKSAMEEGALDYLVRPYVTPESVTEKTSRYLNLKASF